MEHVGGMLAPTTPKVASSVNRQRSSLQLMQRQSKSAQTKACSCVRNHVLVKVACTTLILYGHSCPVEKLLLMSQCPQHRRPRKPTSKTPMRIAVVANTKTSNKETRHLKSVRVLRKKTRTAALW